MKIKITLITFFFYIISFTTFAQSGFKEGYIVNNRQERTDCLIRNIGNEESANNYEYRLKESKEIEKITLSKIEEFGIDNELKCIRAIIIIDVSRNNIQSLQDTIPDWEEGHAFLNTLVEGELASLYSYYNEGETLFFFNLGGSAIEPLVHKRYNIGATSLNQQILYDNTYQEQLKQQLACENTEDAEKLSYTKTDLVRYFTNYNKCKNSEYQQFKSAHVKKGILLIKPGIHMNSAQLSIKNLIDATPNTSFKKKNSVGFGVEAEYIVPFNNYVWGVFTEANYLSYETDQLVFDDKVDPALSDAYTINYKSIEIPVGLSHNINLNKNQRIFFKAAYVPHFILGTSYITFNASHKEKFSTSSRLLMGVGYNFQNLGIEFRYYTPLNITQNIYKRGSNFSQLSMRVSYSFKLMGKRGVR